jgi:glycosyltransferase involved in cell wall biosynthesis
MKISVALIVYNGSKYIRQQLDSILAQTYKVDEIIICDDASYDNTKEILEEYKNNHPNLFFIHYNNQNIRATKNIEKAIQACTGELILLSDQDDYWEPNKVDTVVKWFEQNPDMHGVFTNGTIINSKEIKAHIKIIINFTINKPIVIKGNLYRFINRCF